MSPAGTTDSTIIGARIVSYYEPFEAAVLNLTVINEDNRGAKNLDPLNKMTTDKLIKLFPNMQRVMLATSATFSPANFKNYTTTGLPFKQLEDKEYTFVKMQTDVDWGDTFPFGTKEEWNEYDRKYSYDKLDTLTSIADDYHRELKALKAIINITFNSITSNPGESRRPNTSTG